MRPWPISIEDVTAARQRLRPYLTMTPLRSFPLLDAELDVHAFVKCENHQPTNAFKVRNALSALTGLEESERAQGVVAASTGNYGQGLAWAGRALSVAVTICVPESANPDKVAAIRSFGAQLVMEGRDYDEALEVMHRLVRQRGLCPLHGVNHPLIPAGAGTMTLEILEQMQMADQSIDAMVIAIGGGSQAVGAMTVLRAMRPEVAVYGVGAAGAPTMCEAWQKRRPHAGATPTTFAEGVATRQTYELTFDALCQGLAGFVLVTDREIAEAVRLLWQTTHNLVEPAGAVGVAGLKKLSERLQGQAVALILSGANMDLATLRRVVNEDA